MSSSELRKSLRPPEAARDQSESAFTPILRNVFDADHRVVCVIFVDGEGECIDYVSVLTPFEAKVLGAHCLILLDELRNCRDRVAAGEAHTLEIVAEENEIWARRVSDDYAAVLLLREGADRARLQHALRDACRAFRHEVGIEIPAWELPPANAFESGLRVSVRPAVGWGYAPSAFADAEKPCEISDVLGRWVEAEHSPARICFRVRMADGRELTLIHNTLNDDWTMTV